MRLILGGINGQYLRNIIENGVQDTEEVLAAVAYATSSELLFNWCLKYQKSIKFFGRLDDNVAVSVPILTSFLNRKSHLFTCRLVQHHHAKVIWWRGLGVYIGSANLTDSAWYRNVEAGCFFPENEITDQIASDLNDLFDTLEAEATPLTEELVQHMIRREKVINATQSAPPEFWSAPSLKTWPGLVQTTAKKANDRKRQEFLQEWYSTLQELRDIGSKISLPNKRPSWISDSIPAGAQADQFLHAHYYERTFVNGRANYAAFFENNKNRKEDALDEAIQWWRQLPNAPTSEAEMLNSTAPALQAALSEDRVSSMDYDVFRQICMSVHAIKDYSRRVPNADVGLKDDGTHHTIEEKVDALSKRIWNDHSAGGKGVRDLLRYILYEGSNELLPERLWQAIADPYWKIRGLGVSAIGEIVGWALPDNFPPRNGRTSKALKSLGYDVTVHV